MNYEASTRLSDEKFSIISHHKAIMQVDVSTVQMHDFKLFKQTNPNLTYAKFILADSGYQGIQH